MIRSRFAHSILLLAFLHAPIALHAGTKQFHDVLHTVEKDCGIHHTRLPFVNSFVSLGLRFSNDEGAKQVKDLHFAVFDLSGSRTPHCSANLQQQISNKLGPSWIPFVHVHSSDEHEDVVIYMQDTEKEPMMIVAAVDHEDAAVVQIRFSKEALSKWVNEDGTVRHHAPQAPLPY